MIVRVFVSDFPFTLFCRSVKWAGGVCLLYFDIGQSDVRTLHLGVAGRTKCPLLKAFFLPLPAFNFLLENNR